ncbi:putative photosynthetic complex assembly protein PuhE [Tabrizicola sp.]|uniref:putative photosynthetic complex assembly protein PuhE n=1 Tax=Tabrizicola sp. TaxID=2005166 RepID=UPI003F2F42F2
MGVPHLTNPWIVALSAVFVWWASTGAILWRVRRADLGGPDDHLWSVLLGLPLLVGGAAGAHASVDHLTVSGVYGGFLSALALWGWIELAFLSGVLTGPTREPCPPKARMPERLWRAVGTILWHEFALIAGLLVLTHLTLGQPNPFAALTFATLFFARISAKLNLFFGAPRINTEFLPRPLAHLASHFRKAPMTALLPVSILALAIATLHWATQAAWAADDAPFIGYLLLAVLTALALIEHLFMVLPIPDQKLWRWMLPEAASTASPPAPSNLPGK